MARFRGTVRGGRGEASRLGHATSGLHVKAFSYSGDVEVTMYAGDAGDCVRIVVADHNSSRYVELYNGRVELLWKIDGKMLQRAIHQALLTA